ncbi:arylsulfotransferase family protein [Actinophytocola glycyrrhizae]|uniref:Arylsulfotransferase family protein n=1 Tax=Actinophytocola glycyrrhizae TaxID=2044873 RepID=A0ABV9S3B6_9PSEU
MRTMSRLVLSVVLFLLVGGCAAPPAVDEDETPKRPSPTMEFVSRPDLTPPVINVVTETAGADPGYVLLATRIRNRVEGEPQGHALILGEDAEPVWVMRVEDNGDGVFVNDLAVQSYLGQPVLTYWRGKSPERGWGVGEYVLLDQSYQEVATVRTGDGLSEADFHDMRITPRGTALLVSYPERAGDRSVRDGAVQEVDIASGEVLFEWRSGDHVGLDESYEPAPEDRDAAYDYFHINSVDEDADGNLLVSARHTNALYKIDRATSEVLWRLGGKRSDFTLGEDVAFSWQHDARWLPDGRVSLLDNASDDDREGPPSRGLVLDVDQQARTAELVSAFANPDGHTSGSQANFQVLPDGNSVAGWGSRPSLTEFDADGAVVRHWTYAEDIFSYRAHVAEWTGVPAEPPSVVAETGDGDTITVHVSWNGATEVTGWRVLAGPSPTDLSPVAEAGKTGFETAVELTGDAAFVRVEALDAQGTTTGTSDAVPVRTAG